MSEKGKNEILVVDGHNFNSFGNPIVNGRIRIKKVDFDRLWHSTLCSYSIYCKAYEIVDIEMKRTRRGKKEKKNN